MSARSIKNIIETINVVSLEEQCSPFQWLNKNHVPAPVKLVAANSWDISGGLS
jgi:hypothetical protein